MDSAKIEAIKNLYANTVLVEYPNGKTLKFGDKFTPEQLESLAICAYVMDVNNKSIMSLEETRRVFTGMPHFFKWQYDDKTGDLTDIGGDESKRYGGSGSTGTNNRDDLPNIETDYTCAEIEDWEIASPMESLITEAFKDNEFRDGYV